MDIVQNILNIAKANGLNNQQLCKLLNTNPNKIYDWKVGKSRPSAQDVLTIARHLNVSVDYLLTGEENSNVKQNLSMRTSLEIATEIKALAKAKKIAIGKMLKDCDLSVNTLSSMQSGGYFPRLEAIVKIAEYLNVSVDYLLGISDETGTKKAPTENDERDELVDAIVAIVKTLSPEQKEMLLAQLQGLAGQK